MGILKWVQSRIGVRHEQKKTQVQANGSHGQYESENQKKESNGLPHGLLTIGTFGSSNFNGESLRRETLECSCSTQDIPDFTVEELNKLHNALAKLLSRKSRESGKGAEENNNLPLDKFLNCPSSLEIERCICQRPCNDEGKGEGCISPATKVILNRMKDILVDNRNTIHRKSLSFLLKRIFVCKGGFAPAPIVRDLQPAWRMEKILKAMLQKKIYCRKSKRASKTMYLDKLPAGETDLQQTVDEETDNKSKWVKTDPEYIVLEI